MAVEAGGIGARLRAGREKLGLTVLQVAERIHTDPKIVDSIEAENFEALGAPVYARGHIRHYADLVGESANELVQIYSNLAKVGQPDLTRIVKAPAGPDSSKLVAPALVVVAVFAVAGAIWWISALSKKKPQMSETHVVTDEAPAAASAAAPADSSVAPQGASASGMPAGSPPMGGAVSASPPVAPAATTRGGSATATRSPSAPKTTHTAPPTTVPTSSASTAPATRAASSTPPIAATPATRTAAAAMPRSTLTGTAPAAAAPETPAAPRPKNQSSMTLRYSADSWTEVYDASGARLFYDVGAANSVQTVVGTPPLRVVLGNASGVSVEYNGHSKPIAKLSRPDGSVQFSITRSGEVVRAKPVADGG
jgi:cytoskeleton protein RodZ